MISPSPANATMRPPSEPRHSADEIFASHLKAQQTQADRVLCALLFAQWLFAIFCAFVISPRTWGGAVSSVHVHVWSAVSIGALLTLLPSALALLAPGQRLTRMVMSAAQVMYSVLLIHLMGGRIEAHFHVFGSLAILAFYKDRWVFLPAVAIVTIDHLVRGLLWPQSVFGILSPAPLRAFEHAGWVLFETSFLLWGVNQNVRSLRKISELQSSLTTERDLLERRVALRTGEIERQRQFQEKILQNIPAAVFWKDIAGTFMGCNETFCKFVGLKSPAEIIGKIPRDFKHLIDESGDLHQSVLCRSVDEVEDVDPTLCSNHEELINADGQHRNVVGGLTTLQYDDEEVFGVLGTFQDITSLKQAESQATALAEVIRQSPSEVYIFDAESLRFIEANKGACENLGYTREELLQMTPVDIKPEVTEEALRSKLGQAKPGSNQSLEFITVHQRKDGSQYPVQVNLHRTVFDHTDVFAAFVTDLTHRQELEKQLSQSQKLESMGQLAAGVAHEINTPMQCVSGNVEFLKAGYDKLFKFSGGLIEIAEDDQLDSKSREQQIKSLGQKFRYDLLERQTPSAIEEAAEAVQRVIEIVRAMKVMSHPGNRKRSEVDLKDLIEKASVITRNRWKYAAKMELDVDPDLPLLQAFPAELSQVFINTMVNAADAISEKNGESGELGNIRISARLQDQNVLIEIEDDGAGMPAEVQEKIFDQFFTTKEVGKGTGLGLALTYDIVVQQHGGRLDVKSDVGKGTCFTLTLPIVAPDRPEDNPLTVTPATLASSPITDITNTAPVTG